MPKSRSKVRKKEIKPSPAIVSVIKSLQALVEDREAWYADEPLCLRHLQTSLDNLMKLQAPTAKPVIPKRTKESFLRFENWLAARSFDIADSPFRIGFVDGHVDNATLYATRAIDKNNLIMSIPGQLLLTADNNSSPLAPLLTAVPTLTTMPSIRLALRLLVEASNPTSNFYPYVQTLPSNFSIPFAAFSADEYLALYPSPAAPAAIKSLRAQIRNYTYIYQALHRMKLSTLSTNLVTYENYRWAISIAMSRQNEIPSPNTRQPPTLALIPVWDLCNHAPGEYTTSVALRDDGVEVECRAMMRFSIDDPITIYYGPRPNTQMLLFSGFVVAGNKNDRVEVRIPMQADIELSALKARLLARMGIDVFPNEQGWIFSVEVGAEDGINGALAVARVLVMDKNAITEMLRNSSGLPSREDALADEKARLLVQNALLERLKQYLEFPKETPSFSSTRKAVIDNLHTEERRLLQGLLSTLDNH